MAVTLSTGKVVSEQPNGRPASIATTTDLMVYDGATGEPVSVVAGTGQIGYEGQSLSHDGRLLAGEVGAATQAGRRLTVWDAATGQVLKQWPGKASAAFAPDRPVLATAEWAYTRPDPKETPVVVESSLGLWDLSGLLR